MASIFNIGVSALSAAQRQLGTTSHNIANVNTDGFSRQRVEQEPAAPRAFSAGYIGSGVRVSDISRIADQFLIGQLRSAAANEAKASAYANYAAELDSVLGDGSATAALEGFFAAMHDANGDPASTATREVALNSAQSFATRFGDLDRRFGALARDLNGAIESSVTRINSLSSAIADINDQIMRATGSGEPPNDLLDQRDRLVQDLSEMTGVTTLLQENGALNVFIGTGQAVVADVQSLPLVTVPDPLDGTRLEIATTSNGVASIISHSITSGELGAALDFRDEILEPSRNAIGRLAATFAISFNEQHREGLDLNDAFGRDLFTIGTPNVNAAPANTGSISVAFDPADIGSLTTADYRLSHDGTNFTLLNLADNTTQTLAGAGPFNVEGLTLTVTGAPAAGDVYLLQPTKSIARNMGVAITNPRELALARPNRTSADTANIGSGEISTPVVLDVTDANLLTTTRLVFNDPPTTYQVNGAGPLIPYTSGADIDINGWRVQVSGSPEPGDTFTVAANVGAAGDNGNGLALAELQLTKLLDGATATYQESYSQLVGRVGSKTQELELSRDAMSILRENAQASRDSLSAVNLDEEAAQLLRFQQAYTAAAQVISAANDTFASLLAAVR